MATVAEPDFEPAAVARRSASTRWFFLVPPLFGAFALAAPSFSLGWAIVVAAGCTLGVAAHVVFRLRHGYESAVATRRYALLESDLLAAFATLFAWRLTRTPWWVLVVFAAAVTGVAVLGYVRPRAVLEQRFGAIATTVVAVGAGGGGALGYAVGRSAGGLAVAAAMLVIASYLVLVVQALARRS